MDSHHTVEDTSLAFGAALRQALGDKVGIRRFGDALVPLDEALARAVVDLSGRPYVVHDEPAMAPMIGAYDTTLTRHVWESISASAQICLHVHCLYGRNPHHMVEAQFKAVARALRTPSSSTRGWGCPAPRARCDRGRAAHGVLISSWSPDCSSWVDGVRRDPVPPDGRPCGSGWVRSWR